MQKIKKSCNSFIKLRFLCVQLCAMECGRWLVDCHWGVVVQELLNKIALESKKELNSLEWKTERCHRNEV